MYIIVQVLCMFFFFFVFMGKVKSETTSLVVFQSIHVSARGAYSIEDDSFPCLQSYITSALKLEAKCQEWQRVYPEIYLEGDTATYMQKTDQTTYVYKIAVCLF